MLYAVALPSGHPVEVVYLAIKLYFLKILQSVTIIKISGNFIPIPVTTMLCEAIASTKVSLNAYKLNILSFAFYNF